MLKAQGQLAAIHRHLKDRDWTIVVAVAIYGATAKEIHLRGGAQHRVVNDTIKVAFDNLASFYDGGRRRDSTWKAFSELINDRDALVRVAKKEVG